MTKKYGVRLELHVYYKLHLTDTVQNTVKLNSQLSVLTRNIKFNRNPLTTFRDKVWERTEAVLPFLHFAQITPTNVPTEIGVLVMSPAADLFPRHCTLIFHTAYRTKDCHPSRPVSEGGCPGGRQCLYKINERPVSHSALEKLKGTKRKPTTQQMKWD